MIIDIHTHHALAYKQVDDEVLRVQNVVLNRGESYDTDIIACSLGLHPYYLEDGDNDFFLIKNLENQAKLAQNANVWFIGEAGLDRRSKVTLKVQEKVFEQQIALACTLQKPMVIHCVKAFSELIAIKKRINPNVPMLVHGFNQNLNILENLIKQDFVLSFGAALLQEGSNAQKALLEIANTNNPIFFLETDDQTKISIQQIYAKAATLLKIEQDQKENLQTAIQRNFNHIIQKN